MRTTSIVRALALCSVALAAVSPALAQAQAAIRIERNSLNEALTQLARQSGSQVIFAPAVVRGKSAPSLRGQFTPEQALERLLQGSSLAYERTTGGAYVIQARAASPQVGARSSTSTRPASGSSQDATIIPDQATEIEEVIVIGTAGAGIRRQDAAFAVTNLSAEAISQAAPSSTADLFRLVPGVTAESSGGQNGANIFVRGYPSGGDAEYVTLQSEGVPFFPPSTLSFLENSQLIRIDETLQRVEAVRGGTGALFSSGQPGLTVNFVQREGGPEFEGLAKLSTTDYGDVRADGYVSGPLGPDTTFMVGGYYAGGPGVRDPQFDAERGGQITANVRHRFERGSLLVFGRYLNDRGQWLLPIPVLQDGDDINEWNGFDAGTGTFAGNETRLSVLNDGSRVDLADGRGADIVNLGSNLDFDLSDSITLRNRMSFLSGSADTSGLVPGGAPPQTAASYAASLGGALTSLTYTNGGGAVANAAAQLVIPVGVWRVEKDIEAFVNDLALEVRLGTHTITAGIYHARYSSEDRWNLGNAQLLTAEPNARRLDMTIRSTASNALQQVTRAGFAGGSFFNVNASYDGNDTAFYVTDEWKVSPELTIDGGVRFQSHEVDGTLENNTFGVDTDANPNTLFNNGAAVLNGTFSIIDYDGEETSYTLGANYAFSPSLSAFGRYSRGHSFPFFDNLRDGLRQTQRVDSLEAGLKASYDRFDLYATLFRNEFEGLATTVIVSGAPLASVGGAETTGLELEGRVRPTDAFTVAFSGTWLDATYQDFFANGGTQDLTGNRVQRQPEWQGRITPSYVLPLGDAGQLTLYTTVAYTGDRFSDVQNQQTLPAFYKWDVGVTWDINERIQVQLTGDNLSDEIGLTEGNPRTLGAQGSGVILARPILGRSFRIGVGYRF
ncbi:TonB-dependent receptor [Brevundimonas sp. LM2]|uniref:TonB-dependent receptor n=1 Tax=Brevundimonas sp. LM2 TaxID=1938605 RepID=UPI001237553E|nr:TonB-dependent receptor [Brevundimonas sp. LM2]